MNIKEVAELTRVPAKTIRFYEDIGLIRPGRADNGHRRFSERDLHKLAFIGRARSLGFTVEDCRSLLSLWPSRGSFAPEVRSGAGIVGELVIDTDPVSSRASGGSSSTTSIRARQERPSVAFLAAGRRLCPRVPGARRSGGITVASPDRAGALRETI